MQFLSNKLIKYVFSMLLNPTRIAIRMRLSQLTATCQILRMLRHRKKWLGKQNDMNKIDAEPC